MMNGSVSNILIQGAAAGTDTGAASQSKKVSDNLFKKTLLNVSKAVLEPGNAISDALHKTKLTPKN